MTTKQTKFIAGIAVSVLAVVLACVLSFSIEGGALRSQGIPFYWTGTICVAVACVGMLLTGTKGYRLSWRGPWGTCMSDVIIISCIVPNLLPLEGVYYYIGLALLAFACVDCVLWLRAYLRSYRERFLSVR